MIPSHVQMMYFLGITWRPLSQLVRPSGRSVGFFEMTDWRVPIACPIDPISLTPILYFFCNLFLVRLFGPEGIVKASDFMISSLFKMFKRFREHTSNPIEMILTDARSFPVLWPLTSDEETAVLQRPHDGQQQFSYIGSEEQTGWSIPSVRVGLVFVYRSLSDQRMSFRGGQGKGRGILRRPVDSSAFWWQSLKPFLLQELLAHSRLSCSQSCLSEGHFSTGESLESSHAPFIDSNAGDNIVHCWWIRLVSGIVNWDILEQVKAWRIDATCDLPLGMDSTSFSAKMKKWNWRRVTEENKTST